MLSGTQMLYWIGVVEDRNDPLKAGRVRVRIHGYHTPDLTVLPVADLPWTSVLMPVTSASISGVGTSPLGLVEGSTVIGFFADGEDGQEPIVLGSLPGIHVRQPPKKYGFRDPSSQYPREDTLNESDVNRLSKRQNVDKTVVAKKRDARDTGVKGAFGSSWDQPAIPYNADYPYNHVVETESGHIIELDDTKGNERIHLYHRTGTFTEIDANGTKVTRIVGDGFEIVERNHHVHVKGACSVSVEGDCKLFVGANCDVEVDGNFKLHAHGNIELKAGKEFSATANDGVKINSNDNITLNTSKQLLAKALKSINLFATTKVTLSSPITEVAVLKMNGMGITPIPPLPPIFTSPGFTSSKSASSVKFGTLRLPSPKKEDVVAKITPITESKPMP